MGGGLGNGEKGVEGEVQTGSDKMVKYSIRNRVAEEHICLIMDLDFSVGIA